MSASHVGPDAMVTIKVTYDGTTRRVKMPLREMAPRVLEQHIRTFLHVPVDRKAMIERYSDSAGSFVLLDSANLSVYKQLYRAAKAKSKLKLRVTLVKEPEQAPKPASDEQVPEPAQATESEEKPVVQSEIQQPESQPQTNLPLPTSYPSMSKQYDPTLLAKAAKMVNNREELRKDFESRISCLMSRQSLNSTSPDTESSPSSEPAASTFAVCCNRCSRTIHDAHYHCSTCDDGDYDVCQGCIDQGLTCQSDSHWLIKRSIVDGTIVKSSTEKLSPKPKQKAAKEEPKIQPALYSGYIPPSASYEGPYPARSTAFLDRSLQPAPVVPAPPPSFFPRPIESSSIMGFGRSDILLPFGNTRTCNACLIQTSECKFLHCLQCEDFDLCESCFSSDGHGHHPKHGFAPAVPGTKMSDKITARMAPGRNCSHMAICDGCNQNIYGVRHKCLDCPDWDYCSNCVENASFIHPCHRFAALYEPLDTPHCYSEERDAPQVTHLGICCDGPLCSSSAAWSSYITGTRYKCAICPDLDFCANCEASPANNHNKTHPLIKFKTAVRHVSVTTTGEHHDGRQLQPMGDRFETHSQPSTNTNSVNPVQTVVDVKPEEPEESIKAEEPIEPEVKSEEPLVQFDDVPQAQEEAPEDQLRASFVRESVSDGTIYGLNHVFEQTWTLRNDGNVPWPAGCVVKFSGGDYMGHVDSAHPTGISDLVSASQSTVCYSQLAPGQEFQFTVLLRTPTRAGKFISYWRLCTGDGYRFGERLWCEIQARSVKAAPATPSLAGEVEEHEEEEQVQQAEMAQSQASNTIVFPKLEAESPIASVHEEAQREHATQAVSLTASPVVTSPATRSYLEWDGSDDGFMTDEEYDILDASDEEFLEEQHRKMVKE